MSENCKGARQTISVVIPTRNVEPIIRRCLDSVAFADEVVIVDMYSTDDTERVCRSYPNVRFFRRQDYIYGNFNYGLEQATSDWILRLDSDEVINPELQREVLRVLEAPPEGVNGFYFPSVQYMFGEPMRHGVGLPELCLRLCLFRKGKARYLVKSEHEGLTADGPFGVLGGYYEHFTNYTTSEVIQKYDYYTSKDVERVPVQELGPPSVWRILYRCVRRFIWSYIQRKGYRDGALGFFSSAFRGPVYILIEEAKRWERWKAAVKESDQQGPQVDHPEQGR